MTVWQVIGTASSPPFNCEHGIRSVAISPSDYRTVIVGSDNAYLSTDDAANFTLLPTAHVDQDDIAFGPANSLYIGSDGGISRSSDYTTYLTNPLNPINGNLSNFLFYRGTIDSLNYGISWGGHRTSLYR